MPHVGYWTAPDEAPEAASRGKHAGTVEGPDGRLEIDDAHPGGNERQQHALGPSKHEIDPMAFGDEMIGQRQRHAFRAATAKIGQQDGNALLAARRFYPIDFHGLILKG